MLVLAGRPEAPQAPRLGLRGLRRRARDGRARARPTGGRSSPSTSPSWCCSWSPGATSPPSPSGRRAHRRAAGLPRHGHGVRRRRAVPHRADGAGVQPGRRFGQVFVGLAGVHARPRVPDADHVERHRDRAQHARRAHRAAHPAHPARARPQALDADPDRGGTACAALLDRFGGRDSLGYFALRGDKTAIFSPTGKAAVVYRVVGGVTLAAGDPLGDPEAWPGAIEAWLDEADRYAWMPGVIGASEDAAPSPTSGGPGLARAGRRGRPATWTSSAWRAGMRGVRQAVNRVRRAGYTVDVRAPARHAAGGAREAARDGRGAARRRRRARLLDGARPARRPGDPELVVAARRDAQGGSRRC